MGTYEQLKAAISAVIKANGKQEITGTILQNTLNTIVSTVGINATFAGVASVTTNPGLPDQNVFYIATEPGTYQYFNDLVVSNEVAIFQNKSGAWVKLNTGLATAYQTGWGKMSAPWLERLGGTNPAFSVPNLDLVTRSIRDIWFSFPNGQPSWWANRKPQLRALNGGLLSSVNGLKIRLYFRLGTEEQTNDYTVDYSTTYIGGLEMWKIPVSIGAGEPTFYAWVYIDTTPLMGLTYSVFTSEMSQATQPMIVPKIYNGINTPVQLGTLALSGNLTYDKTTRIVTIPAGTFCLVAGSEYPPVNNTQLNLSAVTGNVGRVAHIYYDTNTQQIVCTGNTKAENNAIYGGSKVLVGTYDQTNNQVYFYGWKWEVNGLERGIDYIGGISSAKTILFSTPIQFNPKTWQMVVAANTRIVSAKGNVVSIVPGTYDLYLDGQGAGFTYVYIKNDGTIISSYYANDQTYNMAKYMYIGWFHTTVTFNKFDFPNLLGNAIVDTTITIGKGVTYDFSQWLSSYTPVSNLQPNIDVAISAIKDIWFDFPGGIIPDWFNERKPILRAICTNDTTAPYPFRIYFLADKETAYGTVYALDLTGSNPWGTDGTMLLRLSNVIEGTTIICYVLINGNEIKGDFIPDTGIVISSAQGLQLKAYIKPKTTPSVYSLNESLAYGRGVKTILNTSNTYIEYNSDNNTITIPANTRMVNYRGVILTFNAGTFEAKTGFSNCYYEIATGDIISVSFTEQQKKSNWKYWDENRYIWIGWTHNALRAGQFNALSYKINGVIVGTGGGGLTDLEATTPQIFNNPIRRRTIDTPLRMVCFGSSWFQNTWWYMNKILQSAGINAELTCFYTGGAYFSQWIDRWNNNTAVDCWKSTNGSNWTQTTAPFKTTLMEGWDIIAYQQGAHQAIDWAGYWENQWSQLLRYIKQACGVDTVIAFNSTWTPGVNGNLSPYPNTVDGQKQWQTDNYTNTRRFMALSGIQNVSPNGANIWAMRRNPALNLGNDLVSDNLHPDNGLPMYSLSGCFFQTFIAPMYGISFDAVDWLPDASTQKAPVSGSSFQSIDTTQRDLIRQTIKLALSDRFGFNEL